MSSFGKKIKRGALDALALVTRDLSALPRRTWQLSKIRSYRNKKIQSLKIQVVQEHPKEAKVQQSIDLEPIPCKEVTPKFNLDNPSVEESQDEEVHLKTHVDTSDATMEEPSIEVGPNVPYLDPTTLKIGEHEKTQGWFTTNHPWRNNRRSKGRKIWSWWKKANRSHVCWSGQI